MQLKETKSPWIPRKPWEVVRAGLFTLHNKYYLCIVDYHSKFSVIKMVEDLLEDSLILACRIIFSEYGLPKKIMSDAGGNIISDKFKRFCQSMKIEQTVFLLYHHHSNGQVEACIKFIKCSIRKGIDTKSDIHISLLQIRSTPLD